MREALRGRSEESPAATEVPDCASDFEILLAGRIAAKTRIALEDVDVQQPFSTFGLSSTALVGLSGELEKLLGRRFPSSLAWDYPSIAQLSRHLASGEEGEVPEHDHGDADWF